MTPQLFLWLSPVFPVGAYAYSQGLERAAEAGLVRNRRDLERWIEDLFLVGAGRTDLIVMALAHKAIAMQDAAPHLRDINTLALALAPSSERYLETTQQGGSFLDAISASWPHTSITAAQKGIGGPVVYPVASAAHGIALQETLKAFGLAYASNFTSAAIRLSIIGQTDAQRVLAMLVPVIDKAALAAENSTLDEIATAAWSADLSSLEHETQYSRLFRS
jgi:urease accessory protein